MTEDFNRAPGAGRLRGPASGLGLRDVLNIRQPERGDGDAAKASVFSRCEALRQPRTSPPVPEDEPRAGTGVADRRRSSQVSNPARGDGSDPVVLAQSSQLSASAPEFVPACFALYQDVAYEDPDSEGYYAAPSLTDWVQEFLGHLNSSPGSFESVIDDITATLNDWVTTPETLQELVELIFTQATSTPNFTYTGARLCNHLSQHLTQSTNTASFRQLLLQRCHVEFEQRQQALVGDEETQKRFHSYVLFLGELYLNLEVKNKKGVTSRADVLLNALKDLIDTLCSHPTDANLMCAIKLLKLTGSVLEDAWKLKGQFHMDELIKRMKAILLDAKGSRDVREMLLRVVEVRSSNWGRVNTAVVLSEATPDNDPNYYMNEPTFYTADGTPFTAADPDYSEQYQEILDREDLCPELCEENGNEAFYADEDEMDPEIEEAFEKFCQESERKP